MAQPLYTEEEAYIGDMLADIQRDQDYEESKGLVLRFPGGDVNTSSFALEHSGITTKFEPPHSIDLLHHLGSVSEYTATWQGRTITAEFETSWDDVRGDMHVSVGVMAPRATDVELDMLEAWWLEWHEKQGEEL